MFKHIVLVGLGSAMGGIVRYLVSRLWASSMVSALPSNSWLTPGTRLLLTTGFCGGFTTFSTFMNENANFLDTGMSATAVIYTLCSLVFGFLALLLGQQVARIF